MPLNKETHPNYSELWLEVQIRTRTRIGINLEQGKKRKTEHSSNSHT